MGCLKMDKLIYDLKTNNETIVALNEKEVAERIKDTENFELLQAQAAAKAEAKQALLDRLGITAEEAALLGL